MTATAAAALPSPLPRRRGADADADERGPIKTTAEATSDRSNDVEDDAVTVASTIAMSTAPSSPATHASFAVGSPLRAAAPSDAPAPTTPDLPAADAPAPSPADRAAATETEEGAPASNDSSDGPMPAGPSAAEATKPAAAKPYAMTTNFRTGWVKPPTMPRGISSFVPFGTSPSYSPSRKHREDRVRSRLGGEWAGGVFLGGPSYGAGGTADGDGEEARDEEVKAEEPPEGEAEDEVEVTIESLDLAKAGGAEAAAPGE